jgi:hypothetical protein
MAAPSAKARLAYNPRDHKNIERTKFRIGRALIERGLISNRLRLCAGKTAIMF